MSFRTSGGWQVWERPTSEIAVELGISNVAVGKLCQKLQVPKPPRGYWARVGAGQTPRRPPLKAFREELEEMHAQVLISLTARSKFARTITR